ncbi:MAG: leucine-rich repeat domain-containing protein [Lachnospiraceae bacterium]|nr:leucine-rich repeat domain-containing protein [Lachnospiraceae bacterium]
MILSSMQEYICGSIKLLYEVTGDEVSITGFEGSDAKLSIPDYIEDHPVTSIAKKVFLGLKGLKKVSLPEKLSFVDDWAFSQCIHLTNVEFRGFFPSKTGRGIFEGCERIENIAIKELMDDDVSFLLAAVVKRLSAQYLMDGSEIGSEDWYGKWDLALTSFLLQSDFEGYSDRALCGEEDISYDGIGSVDGELLGENAAYVRQVGKNKSFLCLLRLRHDKYLSDKTKEVLKSYIIKHSKGATNEAAWFALKEDLKNDTEYFKVYMDVVNPDMDMFNSMLLDMGEELATAKAYLISLRPEKNKTDAFFDDLIL